MGWFDTDKIPTSPDTSTYLGLPPDLDDWNCSAWQIYLERNKQSFGIVKAREYFMIDVGRLHAFSDMGDCKYDCDFVDYLRDNGIEYNNPITNVYCGFENITQSAENITTFGTNVTKWIFPIAVIGGIAYLFKDEIKKQF